MCLDRLVELGKYVVWGVCQLRHVGCHVTICGGITNVSDVFILVLVLLLDCHYYKILLRMFR